MRTRAPHAPSLGLSLLVNPAQCRLRSKKYPGLRTQLRFEPPTSRPFSGWVLVAVVVVSSFSHSDTEPIYKWTLVESEKKKKNLTCQALIKCTVIHHHWLNCSSLERSASKTCRSMNIATQNIQVPYRSDLFLTTEFRLLPRAFGVHGVLKNLG